jgi:hypothetical protein
VRVTVGVGVGGEIWASAIHVPHSIPASTRAYSPANHTLV